MSLIGLAPDVCVCGFNLLLSLSMTVVSPELYKHSNSWNRRSLGKTGIRQLLDRAQLLGRVLGQHGLRLRREGQQRAQDGGVVWLGHSGHLDRAQRPLLRGRRELRVWRRQHLSVLRRPRPQTHVNRPQPALHVHMSK